jgi:hypothetical protein
MWKIAGDIRANEVEAGDNRMATTEVEVKLDELEGFRARKGTWATATALIVKLA